MLFCKFTFFNNDNDIVKNCQNRNILRSKEFAINMKIDQRSSQSKLKKITYW